MKKLSRFSEWAFLIGELTIAFGTACMEKANLGISMVVAPAYLISLKVDFLTFGMAEYLLQAFLLLILFLVIGRFRVQYLLSFVSAVIYGYMLDFFIWLIAPLPDDTLLWQLFFYAGGMLIVSFGVAMMFRTYLPPAVYELAVREISLRYHLNINRFKIAYDCGSCLVAVILSLLFFGDIRGVGIGTIVCAFLNGVFIGLFSRLINRFADDTPAFPRWQAWFRGDQPLIKPDTVSDP